MPPPDQDFRRSCGGIDGTEPGCRQQLQLGSPPDHQDFHFREMIGRAMFPG
jgi:hypothetical protein